MNPPPASASRTTRPLLFLAAAGLGWAAGHYLRHPLSGPGTAPASPAMAAPPAPAAELSLTARRAQLLSQPGGLARRLALLRLTTQAPAGDWPALLNDPSLPDEEASKLVRQWAERDPAACWDWQIAGGRPGTSYTWVILNAWAEQDPGAAAAAVMSAPAGQKRSAAHDLLNAWAHAEGGNANGLTPYLDRLAAEQGSFLGTALGTEDPGGKYSARILSLPPGLARSRFLSGYGLGLFDKDWEKGAAWAEQLPEGDRAAVMERLAHLSLLGLRVIPDDGQDRKEPGTERQTWAQNWLKEQADPAQRSRLGPLLVRKLAATDPAAALAWAQDSLDGLPLSQAVGAIITTRSGTDRAGATALIEGLPPGGVRMKATQALMESWLPQEPDAAIEWALAQGKESMSSSAWDNLASQWSYADPEGFQKYTIAHAGELPSSILTGAAYSMVSKDAPGAMRWAASLPETVRPEVVRHTLSRWAQTDPAAAAGYLSAHPGTPASANTLNVLAGRFYTRDSAAAVDWAQALPPGEARDAAVRKLRESIQSEKDPARRAEWLQRLPPPPGS